MIEMQLIGCATDNAPASISFPDSYLYGRRNYSTSTGTGSRRKTEIFLSFDSDELELEHFPIAIIFLP